MNRYFRKIRGRRRFNSSLFGQDLYNRFGSGSEWSDRENSFVNDGNFAAARGAVDGYFDGYRKFKILGISVFSGFGFLFFGGILYLIFSRSKKPMGADKIAPSNPTDMVSPYGNGGGQVN